MGATAVVYEGATEHKAGFLHTLGFGLAAGMGSEAIGFGRGNQYIKMARGGVFGGGWQNRFAMGAKGAVFQLGGMEATTTAVGSIAKRHPFSLFGWRNIQGEMIEAATKETGGSLARGAARRAVPKSFAQAAKKYPTKMLGQAAGTIFGAAFVGLEAYRGYQEGGLLGAVTASGKEAAMWAMMGVGETLMSSILGAGASSFVAPVAIAAGAAYGGYKALKAGGEVAKNLRHLDMVTPTTDPHGFGYTMRQRSLMAIQKSYINGRLGVGNEALMMHGGMRR